MVLNVHRNYAASSLISTQAVRRVLTASVDSCAEIECPFSGVESQFGVEVRR